MNCLLRMWWANAKRTWRVWSDAEPSDGPVSWFRKVRLVVSCWWCNDLLTLIAKMVATETDAGLEAKLDVSMPLLDRVLALQRIVERPGPGWYGVETSRFAYYYARTRRCFVRQRLNWVQAKLRVAMGEVQGEMDS